MDAELEDAFRSLKHPVEFRDGFWIYTLQRLFALTQYHLANPVKSILHVESDVSLSFNFPFLKLIAENHIHWTPFNDERDVASLLYLPSQNETTWLEEEFLRNLSLKEDYTDMTILRSVSRQHPSRIKYFPVIESPVSQLLRNNPGQDFLVRASDQYKIFHGLFDAAPIGMWLTGQDPKNHRGRVIKFKAIDESDLNPIYLKGSLDVNGEALLYNGTIPIYNLHIHSKDKKFFTYKRTKLLRKLIQESKEGETKSKFSTRAYLVLVKGFIYRRFRRILDTATRD